VCLRSFQNEKETYKLIVHRECSSTTHFQIETSETMTAAFEESGEHMIFTKSPSIMATNVLYNDPVEFDRVSVICVACIED
jgi:hypothetical protein